MSDVTRQDAPIGYGIVQVGRNSRNGVPVVAIRDLPTPSLRLVHRAAPEIEAAYKRSRVVPGDILVSVKGTTGRVGEVPPGFLGNISRDVARIRLRDGHVPKFWYQLLRSDAGQRMLQQATVGSTRQELSIQTLRTLTFDVPAEDEQRRIGDALADVDALVLALEQVIAKKQAIKQGVMQQLLTGRTRLLGFNDAWKVCAVGDLLDFKNGLNKGSEYFGSGTPIVNFMDVMHGPVIRAADLDGLVRLTRDEIKRFSARRGDMFFTRTSESVDEVGTAAVLVDDVPDACFSGFILRGRPRRQDGVDTRFLSRAFGLEDVRAQVMASATYTTRALTNGGSLGRVKVSIPEPEEQRAIAGVLEDVDAEIEALRSRLAKARDIKAGMMQELLSGRTRMPFEGDEV